MEELRIKCPSCGLILEVRNSKDEAVKRIVCPKCKKHLAITFREEAPKPLQPGALHFGEAVYLLKEGRHIIGRKHPSSHADIQIATGDLNFSFEHAVISVVRIGNDECKCILKMEAGSNSVSVNDEPLLPDDELVLSDNDQIQLGDSILIYKAK